MPGCPLTPCCFVRRVHQPFPCSTQAAISIDNARLYTQLSQRKLTLEEKVPCFSLERVAIDRLLGLVQLRVSSGRAP